VTAASATRPERGFLIDRDLPSEHLGLITDADRLLQVLINVISNARKYCDAEHPVLTIRVQRPQGGGAVIDVIDNGSGIDSGRQSLIFEKFAA
ncbi:Sensor histidine kinase, partial [marine sediment metagenome]